MDIKATIDMNFDFRDLDIDNIVQRELKSTASNIEEQAKKITPVDTGRLKKSIKADVKGLEANIGTDVIMRLMYMTVLTEWKPDLSLIQPQIVFLKVLKIE